MKSELESLAVLLCNEHFPEEGRAVRAQVKHVVEEVVDGRDPRSELSSGGAPGQAGGHFEALEAGFAVLKTVTTLYAAYKMVVELRSRRKDGQNASDLVALLAASLRQAMPSMSADEADAVAATCAPRMVKMLGK